MDHTRDPDLNPDVQKTLELIMAGRTADLPCPFCHEDNLEEEGSAWGKRYVCPKCDKSIEAPPED